MDAWFVYVIRCADGTLYTGVARDVAARMAQHERGKGARYTRGRGPLALVAKRRCGSHGDALRLELAVKKLTRDEKERLVDARRFRAVARAVSRLAAPLPIAPVAPVPPVTPGRGKARRGGARARRGEERARG